jgi:hypothetical protein
LDNTLPGGLVKGYKLKMKPNFVKICFVFLLLSSFASTLVSSAIWQWIDPKHPKAVASKERIAQELGRRPIKCIFALERVDVSIFILMHTIIYLFTIQTFKKMHLYKYLIKFKDINFRL